MSVHKGFDVKKPRKHAPVASIVTNEKGEQHESAHSGSVHGGFEFTESSHPKEAAAKSKKQQGEQAGE